MTLGIAAGGDWRQFRRLARAEAVMSGLPETLAAEAADRARPGSPVSPQERQRHLAASAALGELQSCLNWVDGAEEAEYELEFVIADEALWWQIRSSGHVPQPKPPSILYQNSESLKTQYHYEIGTWVRNEHRAMAGIPDPTWSAGSAASRAADLLALVHSAPAKQAHLIAFRQRWALCWSACGLVASVVYLLGRHHRLRRNAELSSVRLATRYAPTVTPSRVRRVRTLLVLAFSSFTVVPLLLLSASSSLFDWLEGVLPARGPLAAFALAGWAPAASLGVILPVGWEGWLQCRKRLRSWGIARALAYDGRPPVVYLRPFRDDAAGESRRMSVRTSEELMAVGLGVLGPVIAIGRPGSSGAPLGARRLYVSDEGWREAVVDLVAQARLVVLRVGSTGGVVWELDHVLAAVPRHRLVLLVPGGQGSSTVLADLEQRLGTPLQSGERGARDPWIAGVVRFSSAGTPICRWIDGRGSRGLPGIARALAFLVGSRYMWAPSLRVLAVGDLVLLVMAAVSLSRVAWATGILLHG